MKKLVIVVPQAYTNMSSIIGSYKLFLKANEYRQSQGGTALFDIKLAGVSKKVTLYDDVFAIQPHLLIKEVTQADLVIIPALRHGNFREAVDTNEELVHFILDQYRKGAEIASICTGAFLLAATNLLEGKECSTHWNAAVAFREMFPNVNLVTEKLITDENGIYTNGGAFSFLNLMLHLIEKYYDRSVAIFCAKVFQIDIDRNSQSPFAIFNGQKDHTDEVVMKAQLLFEKKLQDKVSIEAVAAKFAVSRRNFDRRFVEATGNTPLEYIQRVRIEAAKKTLETGRKTVSEVMYDVGYTDMKAFREVFRKITGLTPLDYRSKYNREKVKE